MSKNPKYAQSYYYHALTLEKLGRIEEASEQISKAVDSEIPFITFLTREQIRLDDDRLQGVNL